MTGCDRLTGKSIEGLEYLKQRIENVLSTPIGSVLMKRDFGSNLYLYVDAPVDRDFRAKIYREVAVALNQWVPDFELSKIELDAVNISQGKIILNISGIYKGEEIQLAGVSAV